MTTDATNPLVRHPQWHDDLPSRPSAALLPGAALGGKANFMDDKVLEVGRVPVLVRGVLLAFLPAWIFAGWAVLATVGIFDPEPFNPADEAWYIFFAGLMLLICLGAAWSCIRLDTRMPRQTPVRFSRASKKVYWNGHQRTWNPFGKWRQGIKVWNWDTVQAQIHKIAGFNGKVYVVRYRLELVSCEPGTNKVIDREYLSTPGMTTIDLEQTWAYICAYMERGPKAVPAEAFQDQSVHYIRSLLTYYEWALPGRWGAQARKDMFGQGVLVGVFSLFMIGVTIVGAPVFLYLGVTNYFALKWAPELGWPRDVDAESRGVDSASLDGLPTQHQQQLQKPLLSSIVAATLTALVAGWLIYAIWLRRFFM
jgi:hypothetical protein